MNENMVSIRFKKSWQPKKWCFDGWFGFLITIGNFMDGIFNSYCHTELDFLDGNSWSASESKDRIDPKTGKNNCGVGFKKIKYSHPERWDSIKFDCSESCFPKYS